MRSQNHMLAFLGVFFLVFFVTAIFLYSIDFVPEPPQEENEGQIYATEIRHKEIPTRIHIPVIGVDTPINNPQSSRIDVLDEALLSGAVRYPGSSFLGEDGTMFIFGHQSYLPVIRNQAFQAFNGLQELKPGDRIYVSSGMREYEYRVISVIKVRAEDALISLSDDDGKLILSTCDSFGDPGERYVVEAEIISSQLI
jgi:LPXTG-site transpeptidase (sortase) family protein